jgi:hypothetical protein
MITDEALKSKFSDYDNNMCMCSLCCENMPKQIHRVSFGIKGRQGYRYVRLCELCILRLSVLVCRERIEKWKEELLIKQV